MVRNYDHTCTCRAYRFPHRFGGGKCSGINMVQEYWDKYYGHTSTCRSCPSFNEMEHVCEVLNGGNAVHNCDMLIEFVQDNGLHFIPIYKNKVRL